MSNTKLVLEVCANSIRSALNAERGGAHRIELCQSLELGGLTPSYGLIKACIRALKIPIHVLIRPRAGNFAYSSDEFEIMLQDIAMCKGLGCAGVAIGVTDLDGNVEVSRTKQLVKSAGKMSVTFHRAFDDCPNLEQALEDVISTGCQRVLTSGGCVSAMEGTDSLMEILKQAGDRLVVMAGAGITSQNVVELVKATGVQEVHTSAKRNIIELAGERNGLFDVEHMETDAAQVRAIVQELRGLT